MSAFTVAHPVHKFPLSAPAERDLSFLAHLYPWAGLATHAHAIMGLRLCATQQLSHARLFTRLLYTRFPTWLVAFGMLAAPAAIHAAANAKVAALPETAMHAGMVRGDAVVTASYTQAGGLASTSELCTYT